MSLEWTIIDGDGGHEAPVALELLASTATCRLTFRAAGPLGQPPLAALTGALDAEVFGPALTEAVAELKKTEAYKRLIYLNREVGVYLQFAKSAAKKIAKLEKERQDLEKSSEPNLYAKLRAIDNQLAELKKEH